ncbi:hypothetical protein [Catellatospora sp. IY07-71]|uniref:hypothetical protein n=1 Tax=Catellatospora sp. IY07-71 TaxID=2728827 RepID=UPI001BB3874A|nr:hypothetical protein [Catellatospora sp. IY07-71]
MTLPPPPGPPGPPDPMPPGAFPPPPPPFPPLPPPQKNNTGLIIGVIAGVLVLCLAGLCVGGFVLYNANKSEAPSPRTPAAAQSEYTYSPPPPPPTTEAAPPPAPVSIGDCISVDVSGTFLGVGNCNGSQGTYRVLSVDYKQNSCSDPAGPYITVDGYRLCLQLHLVRTYCYKFATGSGFVTAAAKCKAKGTVHVIDIVPGASNGNKCTKDYKWNRWYRFTHPTVVYCVMQY